MKVDRMGVAPLFLVLLLAGVIACSPAEEPRAEGPGGVVQDFYGHLNAGAYDEAKAMYSTDARSIVDAPDSTDDMFAGWALQETKQGSIERVRVLSSDVGDGEADVEIEILYGDGSSATKSVTLIEENGEWKLNLVA